MTEAVKIRTGDRVRHKSSGEVWIVAAVDSSGGIYPCGWPEGRVSDEACELLYSCSDPEHWELIGRVASIRDDHGETSVRRRLCSALLEKRHEAECLAMLHL